MNLTVSFGQPSPVPEVCYTAEELRAISLKLVEGQQCDTILSVVRLQLSTKDQIIETQENSLEGMTLQNAMLEGIIVNHEINLGEYQSLVEEQEAKVKQIKFRMGMLSGGLGLIALLALIK